MEAVGYGAVELCKCLWVSLAKPVSYIFDPTENLGSLRIELQRLMNLSADIVRRVEVEEVAQLGECTNQVAGWLKEVQDLVVECDKVLSKENSHRHNKCLVWFCIGSYPCSYKLGKKVSQLRNSVKECQATGRFDKVVISLPPSQVRAMPMEKTVGLDSMLSEVWKCLLKNDVGIIGLFGMGGVGKTSLMKRINEELRCMMHGFDFVKWVVVSKQANMDKIRDSVRKDLGIRDDAWRDKSEYERAGALYGVLSRKKFVLLMDDIWERLDLSRIGIPIPDEKNGSKIVFTTRLEEICGQMEAKMSIRVQCLTSEEALELFKEKAGSETLNLHHDIPRIAKLIVEECKGLPLALITIGRAMATKKNPREWEYALNVLRSYPSRFSRMEDDVYKLLEFSYYSLNDSTMQQCFLYCALFPEDYNIHTDHLIDLWIGEGFLFNTNNTNKARLEGEFIIGCLKSACLLESGTREDKEVKMHDVIRDMALWLAHDHGEKKNRIIEEEEDASLTSWKEAERVSLHGCRIKNVTKLPVCSSLVTLLINDSKLETLPEGFSNSMQALKVLDMFKNPWFTRLPTDFGGLFNLLYLNLSRTNIEVVPNEMKYLTSLLYLLLDETYYLEDIPKEVISSLLSLKVFRKSGRELIDERGLVEGLEGLDQLDELSLNVYTAFSVHKLLVSPNLQRSIRDLIFFGCADLTAIKIQCSSLRKMLSLYRLALIGCDSLKSIEIYDDGERTSPRHLNHHLSRGLELTSLHHVLISGSKLRNLTWLIYAPNLQTLCVNGCYTLEKIIAEDIQQYIDENASLRLFSSLTHLELTHLPDLRSIHNQTLSSPSLTQIHIFRCPSLKKLPFDSNSGKNSLGKVEADATWWNSLEWDDEEAKAYFTSKLITNND